MAKKERYYLGNPNLPTGQVEFEYTAEMLRDIKRSKKNLLYFAEQFFYIIDPDTGRQKIKLFDYQRRCLNTMSNNRKVILLASRQVGKTTLMTIYALWVACFESDKNVVIVANKESTAKEIYKRVQMAYTELPGWLKPGVDNWGQTGAQFANGSRIWISTTTGSSARGTTINCLILDELAFIEPESILEEFWRSVYPTISRAKTSKVLIASTPNGTGNLFHRLVEQAGDDESEFQLETVMWNEIPGRDENFMKTQIAELGSIESFEQEYCCKFLDSGDAAIDDSVFKRMAAECMEPDTIIDDGRYKLWEEPDPEKLYVAGVDVSEGVNQDASVINILDITDLTKITQVAEWYSNTISPAEFSVKCKEILDHWGQPLALIERNNQGGQVIDRLINDMNYPNIVSYGSNIKRVKQLGGMISHTNTKYKAVMNQRYFINQIGAVVLRDIDTLKEFQTFIKMPNGTWRAKNGKKDDKVMSLTWALMILEKEITEKYFDIEKLDDFGKPLKITRMDFGIKYYANPTSIYNSAEDGLNSNTIAPIMFGWGMEQDEDPEMIEFGNYLAHM